MVRVSLCSAAAAHCVAVLMVLHPWLTVASNSTILEEAPSSVRRLRGAAAAAWTKDLPTFEIYIEDSSFVHLQDLKDKFDTMDEHVKKTPKDATILTSGLSAVKTLQATIQQCNPGPCDGVAVASDLFSVLEALEPAIAAISAIAGPWIPVIAGLGQLLLGFFKAGSPTRNTQITSPMIEKAVLNSLAHVKLADNVKILGSLARNIGTEVGNWADKVANHDQQTLKSWAQNTFTPWVNSFTATAITSGSVALMDIYQDFLPNNYPIDRPFTKYNIFQPDCETAHKCSDFRSEDGWVQETDHPDHGQHYKTPGPSGKDCYSEVEKAVMEVPQLVGNWLNFALVGASLTALKAQAITIFKQMDDYSEYPVSAFLDHTNKILELTTFTFKNVKAYEEHCKTDPAPNSLNPVTCVNQQDCHFPSAFGTCMGFGDGQAVCPGDRGLAKLDAGTHDSDCKIVMKNLHGWHPDMTFSRWVVAPRNDNRFDISPPEDACQSCPPLVDYLICAEPQYCVPNKCAEVFMQSWPTV